MKISGTYKALRPIVITISSALIILMIGIQCTGRKGAVIDETPTRGNIRIFADASFQPIVDAEIATFTSLYKYAKITPTYVPETDLISAFFNDSVKVVVTAWEPSEQQKELLLNTQVVVRTTNVAFDAIAFVLNKENNDTLFTYQNINDLFIGKLTDWSGINPDTKFGKMSVVFDNEKSANIRFFKDEFKLETQLPPNFYAVKSNEEVIDYVSKNKESIGIVSVNWICDKEDSISRSFTNRIKIAAISQKYLNPGYYYRPVQGSIYDKSYPFTRKVNLVSRETFGGLGSGFVSWFSSEQGQRIVLKSGLVPATMPIRLLQVKK